MKGLILMPSDAPLQRPHWFLRSAADPVLPPGGGDFDVGCCMNPWVVRRGDDYWLYYGGARADGLRTICLATAPVEAPGDFTRHGPVMDYGEPGAFDAAWQVLPHVVQTAPDRWLLVYTANCGVGKTLAAFPGLGLAESTDGRRFERLPDQPFLAPTHVDGDPDAIGMAGGSLLRVETPDGPRWWLYYTGCPTAGDDVYLDQQKVICLATSEDGLHFTRHGVLMRRHPGHDYEDIAVAGPVVSRAADGLWRMWYSAIGSQYGWYAICYAESADGLHWSRGRDYGENLVMSPSGASAWDSQMVEYPSVVDEGDRLRLYHCGNGYGRTGIGMATSAPLRFLPADDSLGTIRDSRNADCATLELTGELPPGAERTPWHGPQRNGQQRLEWTLPGDPLRPSYLRLIAIPDPDGLLLRFTACNLGDSPLALDCGLALKGGAQLALAWDAGGPDRVEPGATVTWTARVTAG